MATNPIKRFQSAFQQAKRKKVPFADALALATVSKTGRPSLRMMLLKGVDARGFVFYTNLNSRKAGELRNNQNVSVTFWWPKLEQQIRIEGKVKPVSASEADHYFASRPRGSQIGAWASRQSSSLKSRAELLNAVKKFEKKFEGAPVPRPPFWSGFVVAPARIEFWNAMPDRLHKREVYTQKKNGWISETLYP